MLDAKTFPVLLMYRVRAQLNPGIVAMWFIWNLEEGFSSLCYKVSLAVAVEATTDQLLSVNEALYPGVCS